MAKQTTGIFDYVSQSGKTFLGKGQQRVTPKQSRPTVDPSVFSDKPAAGKPAAGDSGSGGLASRLIEAPIQTRSPEDMSITDGVASTQPQMITETQQPIENRGGSARYMIQGNGPKIDVSWAFPPRANKAFDPHKAIGGENVPYKSAGFIRRALGDESNVQNIAAQRDQGTKWEKAAELDKERSNRMTDRLAEITELDKGPAARFATTEKRLVDKEINDEIARQNAIDLALVEKGNQDVLNDADRVSKALSDDAKHALEERRVAAVEASVKKPNYQSIGDGLFQTPEGDLAVFQPETMRISKEMPGRPAGFRMLTGKGSKPPAPSIGDEEVDRITGKPKVKLGGPLPNTTPLGPENQNTALGPRFMKGAGEVVTEGFQSLSDPLRAGATGLNKMLFDSNVQQDPEVMKRLKERARINALTPTRSAIPMGQ